MYDITSSCADDFINHEEILDTLAYADQNKENSTLIDSIIQKAKKRKRLRFTYCTTKQRRKQVK